MRRLSFAFALALTPFLASAEDAPASGLEGRVQGKTYISPTGVFKVTIPVLPS